MEMTVIIYIESISQQKRRTIIIIEMANFVGNSISIQCSKGNGSFSNLPTIIRCNFVWLQVVVRNRTQITSLPQNWDKFANYYKWQFELGA